MGDGVTVGAEVSDRDREQRVRVMHAAVEAFAERGADGVRLKDISDRVGMSPGHILYYFGSKDRVLLETLSWSERELADERRAEFARMRSPWRAVRRYVDLYLPVSAEDPRWNLWAQVTARPPEDPEGQAQVAELEEGWIDDLVQWIRRGVADGSFAVEPGTEEQVALHWTLVMNGIAEQVRLRAPGHDAAWARRYCTSGLATALGVPHP